MARMSKTSIPRRLPLSHLGWMEYNPADPVYPVKKPSCRWSCKYFCGADFFILFEKGLKPPGQKIPLPVLYQIFNYLTKFFLIVTSPMRHISKENSSPLI